MNAARAFRSGYFKVQHYLEGCSRRPRLHNPVSRRYEHYLCRDLPDNGDSILRQMHVDAFAEWLNFGLEQQEEDIRLWLHWLGRTPEDGADLLKRVEKRVRERQHLHAGVGQGSRVSARLLIVEDNPANLELMTVPAECLRSPGVRGGDGREGLNVAIRECPDLIVCDVQLPDIEGFEVARCLKSHPKLRAIPLIAVTALAMVGHRDRVLAAGFDGYLGETNRSGDLRVGKSRVFCRWKAGRGAAPASGG